MRIAKYLASCGLGSRRKSEELVTEGRVKVNGEVISNLGSQIEPGDIVLVDGNKCEPKIKVYYLLNKPTGYTSTVSDPHAEKLVTELVPNEPPVWPVGRLDKETSGLIFLTNDGDFTQKLTHPSHEKEKEYIATLDEELSEEEVGSIREGIGLEDGQIKPEIIEKIDNKQYRIVIHEGRNRLVRRIFAHFGKEVVALERVRIAEMRLNDVKSGEYRILTEKEIKGLINA